MIRPALSASLALAAAITAHASDPATTGHPPSPEFEAFPVVHQQPGFQDLAIDGSRITLWNRTYTLGKDGLLSAIDKAGQPLLTGPIRLTGSLDGTDPATLTFTSEVVESLPHAHVIRSRAKLGTDATLEVLTRVENDGMARFTLTLDSPRDLAIQDLTLRLPIATPQADYLHYISDARAKSHVIDIPKDQGTVWRSREVMELYLRDLPPNRRRTDDLGDAGTSAAILNTFLPFVWLGNGSGGLAWFAESDQGWQDAPDRSIFEITRSGDTTELAIHIVMGRLTTRQWTLDFGIQATPVKPLPTAWRTWQHYNGRGLRESKHIERNRREFEDNLIRDFGKVFVFDLDYLGCDTPYRFSRRITKPEATRELTGWLRENDQPIFAYITPSRVDQVENPTDDRLSWRRVPYRNRDWQQDDNGIPVAQHYVCHNAAGNYHHLLAYVESLVTDHGLDGIYIDVPWFAGGCLAPGCCYQRPDGRKQPIFRIFQMRDFYKKLASIFLRHGKEPLVLIHNSSGTLIPAYSWCWAGKPGEFMSDIGYRKNHIEYFRDHRARAIVELSPHPWGLVAFTMDDLKFTRYEVIRKKDADFDSREAFEDHLKLRYLGIPLLHDGLVMNWCSTPKFSYPIQAARKAFGIGADDVTFHPYWDPQSMPSGHPDIALSYYLRPQGVMLNLVNFSDADVTFDLPLSQEVLSRTDGHHLHDALTGEALPIQNGKTKLTIPAQLHRVLMNQTAK